MALMAGFRAFRMQRLGWILTWPDPWTSSNPITCGLAGCGPRAMNEFAFQEIGFVCVWGGDLM